MNGAHQKRFLRTFNVADAGTVRAVESTFLPKLEAERAELKRLNDNCIAQDKGAPFDDWLAEIDEQIVIVRDRLAISPYAQAQRRLALGLATEVVA